MKHGRAGRRISYASFDTPVGLIMVGATDRGLCLAQFGDSVEAMLSRLRAESPGAILEEAPARYTWAELFRPGLPLDIDATGFQWKVWRSLQSIPMGEVRSYSDVAAGIGRPGAARAVARACASNPVAVVIPCHRVAGRDGRLTGYRWGTERKRLLIEWEKASSGVLSRQRGGDGHHEGEKQDVHPSSFQPA